MVVTSSLEETSCTTALRPSSVTTTMHPPLHHHHEVEGRNRCALSHNLLKQHINEYTFERKESYADVSQTSTTQTMDSSTNSYSSDNDSEGNDNDEQDLVTVFTSSRRRVSPASSAVEVRSKFLHKLGIAPSPAAASQRRTNPAPVTLRHQAPLQVPLNDTKPESEMTTLLKRGLAFFQPQQSSSTLSSSSSELSLQQAREPSSESRDESSSAAANQQQHKKAVHFAPMVQVHAIDPHSKYSNRLRATLWTSATEMEENVARNCIEFAAEDWDWRHVLEDQDMVIYHGELVHPVHFLAPGEN